MCQGLVHGVLVTQCVHRSLDNRYYHRGQLPFTLFLISCYHLNSESSLLCISFSGLFLIDFFRWLDLSTSTNKEEIDFQKLGSVSGWVPSMVMGFSW